MWNYLGYYPLMFPDKQLSYGLYKQLSIKLSIQTTPRLCLCLSTMMRILHLLVLVRCTYRSTSWLDKIDISRNPRYWFLFWYILFFSCRAVSWQDFFVRVSINLKCIFLYRSFPFLPPLTSTMLGIILCMKKWQ